ncbi:hypothetical protein [Sodalinema gerasimenkoae]|uniref:hypothetical protein n=1 Tax=Sodalinema gerasimenkoae TaxID=2862348 RepID=UPI00135AAC8D|nr:hypothetical protein [Sodalinema gerasimenkoae]
MNPRQLEQDLELPNIRASLIAYRDAAQKSSWYIRFSISGPDGRYNPGIAVVPSSRVSKLVNDLRKAHQKMKLLEQKRYSGEFSEDFVLRGEVSDTLSVKVSSKKSHFLFWSYKKIRLYFLVSSKTNTFSRSFDSDDVETVINTLSSAESLAKQLINQL